MSRQKITGVINPCWRKTHRYLKLHNISFSRMSEEVQLRANKKVVFQKNWNNRLANLIWQQKHSQNTKYLWCTLFCFWFKWLEGILISAINPSQWKSHTFWSANSRVVSITHRQSPCQCKDCALSLSPCFSHNNSSAAAWIAKHSTGQNNYDDANTYNVLKMCKHGQGGQWDQE